MGREQPTIVLRPNRNRRDERAKRARDTKNKAIPDILRSCPRAKHGIAKAELIVDPPALPSPPQHPTDPLVRPDLKIRVQKHDTLYIAERMSEKMSASTAPSAKTRPPKANVAVLNMASALKPGGGFLEGANGQEEYLCARTTLYPSLWDSFYRLPDVSGIYTPDVLVFRKIVAEHGDLAKNERYFIDVISAGMMRFSDAKSDGCSCGVSYCDRHRDLVLRKMKAVLRIAQSKGVEKLVLGAWGCGAYENPPAEIAKNWRKVIAGAPRQRRPNAERWEGIKEITFAIPDQRMLGEFERAFSDILADDPISDSEEEDRRVDSGAETSEHARTSDLLTRMAEIEIQIEQVHNARLKNTLRATLADLQGKLHQSSRAKAEDHSDNESDFSPPPDGFPASDGEETSFYHIPSPSPSPRGSETYEFRPPSPQHFDAETGWYAGSVEGLTALIRDAGGLKTSASPTTPPEAALPGVDAEALKGYLCRYQGTDDLDY